MKKLILTFLLLATFSSIATTVTLTGPDEEISGDEKICIYSGHGTTQTYTIPNERSCPYSKSFQVD